jgi:tRNA(fMet)-specific endonuclease VapC
MEKFILDTDVCSYIMSGSCDKLLRNLENHKQAKLYITAVTYAKLLYGAHRKDSKRIFEKITSIVARASIISFDQSAAKIYAKLRSELEAKGMPIENMDMLIVACAVANKATLVTNNTKHFSKINGLEVQNWIEQS